MPGFFESVLKGPRRVESIEWNVEGHELHAEIRLGDLICSHAGLAHGGIIGALLIEVACETFRRLGKPNGTPAGLLLRTLEITHKSPVASPSTVLGKARIETGLGRSEKVVIGAELLHPTTGTLHARAKATFGLPAASFAEANIEYARRMLNRQSSSPHLERLVSIAPDRTPADQHLLHGDKPQQHSWMYRTFFGPSKLESLEEIHIGRRGLADEDEVLARWPDSILSAVRLGTSCGVAGSPGSLHPAPLWALMDHVLAHAHVNSHASSAVTAAQKMEFSIVSGSGLPADLVAVASAVSRKGKVGITEGQMWLGMGAMGRVSVKGSATMVDRAPQASVDERRKVFGLVGNLRAML